MRSGKAPRKWRDLLEVLERYSRSRGSNRPMAEQGNPVPTAHPSAATPLSRGPPAPPAAAGSTGHTWGRASQAGPRGHLASRLYRSAVGTPPYRDSLPIPPDVGNRRPSEPRAEPDRLGGRTALGTPGKGYH